MSSLPPLPPEIQQKADQNYAAALDILAAAVKAADTDPKRDRSNDADYHNTTAAMLMQWNDVTKDEGRGVLTMCAAAIIELNRLGWTRPGGDPRETDAETIKEGRRRYFDAALKPSTRPRRLTSWAWPFVLGAGAAALYMAVADRLFT